MTDLTLVPHDGWYVRKGLCDGANDVYQIRECFTDDCYRVGFLRLGRRPGEVIVDVGACIGAFTRKAKACAQDARIFAIEAHPDNIPCLTANCGDHATIINAAMTYEGEVGLLDSIHGHASSGGGLVRPKAVVQADTNPHYRKWPGPIASMTLEQLMAEHGIERIDLLKLDCESSEYSILGKTSSLDRIRAIVGEYHGSIGDFWRLVEDRFPADDWACMTWNPEPQHYALLGYFWLIRRRAI